MAGNSKSKNRMILFMGKSHVHAPPSFQKFIPDEVHIVTSELFRKEHVRRLNNWSKKYGFVKGKVKSVDDLFEDTSVDSLMKCVFEIAESETPTLGPDINSNWFIGFTGGTMHMAASATLAGSIIGARLFYVIKPSEGQLVMANKHVLEFPSLGGLGLSMKVATADLVYLLTKEKGEFKDFEGNCEIPPFFFNMMVEKGLATRDESSWELTSLGKRSFEMILSSNISAELFNLKKSISERKSQSGENKSMWA
jgi:hypothetical protein